MKSTFILLFLIVITSAFAQNVNIPDANFKAYLVGNSAINTNLDTEIQLSEANAFTGSINCPGLNITDLTGIETFVNLTDLRCYNNQLTSLDLSYNPDITLLRCELNQLTSLIFNKTTSALEYVNCNQNQLSYISVGELTNLQTFFCRFNLFTTIDVSQNSLLTYLSCGSNQLTSLNVTQNSLLTYLDCGYNQLTSLDVTQNPSITYLGCVFNQLTGLNVNQNTVLDELLCYNNQIPTLNLSQNTVLTKLNCGSNQLSSLDVSQNSSLVELFCDNNQITNLDVSQNTALTMFGCYTNQLTSLNVQNGFNTNITYYNSDFNPNLACILVDDAVYSTSNWTGIDPASVFADGVQGCGTVSVKNLYNDKFKLYPNPSSNVISIQGIHSNQEYQITNVLGDIVQQGNINKGNLINIESFTNGVYFIRLSKSNTLKFIKK